MRYLNRELIVCASDDQAKTLQRLPQSPLLAKIHGDIFHETKNDASYIAELRPLWHDPLRTLFNRCTPLFIGYGGNDPGFMRFLTEDIDPSWFPDRLVWTYHEKSGIPKGEYLDRLSQRHDILLVPIPGFDEFLFLFSQALELKPLTKKLEADFASRVQAYQASYEAMAASLRAARPKEAHAGGALDRALANPGQRDWREWRDAARNAPTYEDGRHVIEQGLQALPNSPELRSFYARYRVEGNPNDPEAETIARNALSEAERQYGPDHPGTVSCLFELANVLYLKRDFAGAEPLYRRALETRNRVLGPQHPDTVESANNLKWFLEHNKKNRTSGASSD